MSSVKSNLKSAPFFIVFFCLLFFTTISFFKIPVSKISEIDFLSEVKAKDSVPQTIVVQIPEPLKKIAQLKTDTVAPDNRDSILELKEPLSDFFKALTENTDKSQRIHIAYFGDSMIEGDLISNDLRKKLQSKFGGNGVGFVPITSVVAGFRSSITQVFSENWSTYSFVARPPKGLFVGPTGYVHLPADCTFVKYSHSREYLPFRTAQLFYAKTEGTEIKVEADNVTKTIELKTEKPADEIVLHDSTEFKSLKLMAKKDSAAMYGVNFENGGGVYVDNFAFRGSSGLSLSMIPQDVFKTFADKLNYKLIIFQYGLNIVSHKQTNYEGYYLAFSKIIKQIKESAPDASIIIVGASDKGYYDNGSWRSEPNVKNFIKVQQKIADEQHVAFWNLFDSMGGENSIVRWVQEKPSKANADYEHPNHRGAKEIADMFYDFLMSRYENYLSVKDTTYAATPN